MNTFSGFHLLQNVSYNIKILKVHPQDKGQQLK